MDQPALWIGVLAAVAVVWWLVKGLVKLAVLAAIVAAVAWYFYLS